MDAAKEFLPLDIKVEGKYQMVSFLDVLIKEEIFIESGWFYRRYGLCDTFAYAIYFESEIIYDQINPFTIQFSQFNGNCLT